MGTPNVIAVTLSVSKGDRVKQTDIDLKSEGVLHMSDSRGLLLQDRLNVCWDIEFNLSAI